MKNSGWGAYLFAATLLMAGTCVTSAQEAVIYSFQSGSSDGQSPNGGPAVDKNGNLYGTTATGGTHGSGIVYELSPSAQAGGDWTETVIYNFGDVAAAGGSPGITGQGGTVILDGSGNLYGTAPGGVSNVSGELADGVVYELSPPSSGSGDWTAQALYTFLNDSSQPTLLKGPNGAVVFDNSGNLYGIAYGGGANGNGGVFELSPPTQAGGAWTMTALYSFDKTNGTNPWGPGANASLIVDAKGNLYGTTQYGGAASSGTVYELLPPASVDGSWTPAILHSFKEEAPHDGYGPLGSLVRDAEGNLYGTTGAQGAFAGGIVFELSPPSSTEDQWAETILDGFHAFSTTDGYQPNANVVFDKQGNLWGTTYYGGPNYTVDSANSDGVVFELIPQTDGGWAEATTVPYFFGSHASDAYHPNMPIVIDENGSIYSTAVGGANVCNSTSTCGAVWEYTPPPPAAAPTFNPPAGRYTSAQSVTINDETTGATIYYTTDGTVPSTSSTKYINAIRVSASQTIKAIAVAAGYAQSEAASAAYVIETPTATPLILPAASTYITDAMVKITDSTAGATIYYTTNGQAPTTASTKYLTEFKVTESTIVKAIAVAPNFTQSATASVSYTIKTAEPAFSVKPGKYTGIQSVKITDATPGAVIYYTTNGSTPSSKSARYATAITVKSTETIKAIAITKGTAASALAVAAYTIELPTATPVIKPNGGAVKSGSSVTITDATKAAVIYYTSTGVTPTAKSTRYTGAIDVKSNETIKAIAIAPGYTQSAVASAKFTVE